jgi:hypothetical protein
MTKYGTLPSKPAIEEVDEIIVCPKCGSEDISHIHHDGDYAIPETDYHHCNDCNLSWGFE